MPDQGGVPSFTREAYIAQALVVVDHAIDQRVRLRLAEAEQFFGQLVSGEVKSTNVDAKAPPNIPRLVIADNHKQVALGQSRMQLQLQFEPGFDAHKAFDIVNKYAEQFFDAAARFQPLDQRTQLGFVVHRNQPSEEKPETLARYLASRLYGGKAIGTLSTIELKLGFETPSSLFKNLAFSVYQLKTVKLPIAGGEVTVDVDEVPTSELGISSVLDANNRPRAKLGSGPGYQESCRDIVNAMRELWTSDLQTVLY